MLTAAETDRAASSPDTPEAAPAPLSAGEVTQVTGWVEVPAVASDVPAPSRPGPVA